MAQEHVYYSLKFSVLVNCKEADTSSRLAGSAGPQGPAPARHELELFFTIQDQSVIVSLESVWDIICGRGRDNRAHKFNRQVKRLFATTFGTEADAQRAIEAWPDKSVPMHIAVACLIGRATVACASNDLLLEDYYLQLSHAAAHLRSLREQDHDADARSTVRSDALDALPPATASDSEADHDQDEDQDTDADADQDDDPQVANADAVQDAEPVDEEHRDDGSLEDGDQEMAADANCSHEQRVDRSLTEHAAHKGNADVEADGDGSQPDCNDEDGTEEQAADEGDAADVDVTGGDSERHDQAATTGKRASPSSSDLRDAEPKSARTTARAVDDSASDSEAEAVLADANRDSDATRRDVLPIDLAQHMDDLCSLFVGVVPADCEPEAMRQHFESHVVGPRPPTGPVTPVQHVGASCAKMARKFQELLQQLPKERRAAGAMSAQEIEEFSEMASGALTASGASDVMLLEWITIMLCTLPVGLWRDVDREHRVAQAGTQFHEFVHRFLSESLDTATSFINGLEDRCDSDAKRRAFRHATAIAACTAAVNVVKWCARAASAFGVTNQDIAIEILFRSSVHLEVFAADLYGDDLHHDDALIEVVELSITRLGLMNSTALSFLPHNFRQRAYTVWLSQHERENIQVPSALLTSTAVYMLPLPRAFLELIVPVPPFDGKFRACSALWRGRQ